MTAQPLRQDGPAEALRIAYLFSQFPVPTEVFAVSDIAALRRQGHSVTVHTVKPATRQRRRYLALCDVPADLSVCRPSLRGVVRWPGLLWRRRGIAVALLRAAVRAAPRRPGASLQAIAVLPRVLEMAEEVTRVRADVVHAFWARHAGMTLYALKRSAPSAIRSTFAGAYDLVADDFLTDLSLANAEVVFTHAEVNRTVLADKGVADGSIEVVHRGIPMSLGERRAGTRCADRWITAAALVPEKNVQAVIRAFARTRASRPELTLRVCGDGPWRSHLESVAGELGCASSVMFLGHLERGELFEEMSKAACFLLLSKKLSERLPNVLKEALLAGCAVVASDTPGIRELIADDGIGHVVDADDDAAVDAAIDAVLAEDEMAAEARRHRARACIRQHFSTDASMQAYVRAWRTVRQTAPSRSSAR